MLFLIKLFFFVILFFLIYTAARVVIFFMRSFRSGMSSFNNTGRDTNANKKNVGDNITTIELDKDQYKVE